MSNRWSVEINQKSVSSILGVKGGATIIYSIVTNAPASSSSRWISQRNNVNNAWNFNGNNGNLNNNNVYNSNLVQGVANLLKRMLMQ